MVVRVVEGCWCEVLGTEIENQCISSSSDLVEMQIRT